MKEDERRKEPIQQRIERLVSHFGCEPDSIKFLRRIEDGKFFTILEAEQEGIPKIIKATADRRNAVRLQVESDVLSGLPREHLSKKDIILSELEKEITQFEEIFAIMINKIPEGKKPSFFDFCLVLEVFRKMEIPDNLKIERVELEDYLQKTLTRLRFLKWTGALKGLRSSEIERIKEFYQENSKSLKPFDQVFVHGDFKEEHVRSISGKLGVIDFDKSVIGSELEDWAWLSVRHPLLSKRIITHLKDQFIENEEKLKNFDTAFRLMQIDRLIEAYFTRTYQWRGNLDAFSYISKAWGRVVLNIMLSP